MKTRIEFKIHYGDVVNSIEQYEPEEEKEGPEGLVEDANEETNPDPPNKKDFNEVITPTSIFNLFFDVVI